MSDLITGLRSAARSVSAASKMLADAKTKRNVTAGDTDCYYEYLQPEQTTEWKAADEIERLRFYLRQNLGVQAESLIKDWKRYPGDTKLK